MRFDITSEQANKKFLCNFLNIIDDVIVQYIEQCEVCVEDFLEHTNRSIDDIDINDLHLTVDAR